LKIQKTFGNVPLKEHYLLNNAKKLNRQAMKHLQDVDDSHVRSKLYSRY
jgi:hypothetical protein